MAAEERSQLRTSRVSIVVPTLNEAATVAEMLRELREHAPREIILVDGGSDDATLERADGLADRVFVERGGLARQLNRGLAEARGDVVLFNYADTSLPEGALDAVARALSDERVVGGAFRLGFRSSRRAFRCIGRFGNWRNRLGFGPFGDQSIFARRETLRQIGGYASGAFLEDLDLVRRLRRHGRFVVLPLAVRTSVRRWEETGIARTLALHWTMSAAYLLGARRRGPVLGAIDRFLKSRRRS